jgi:hypothetical protein
VSNRHCEEQSGEAMTIRHITRFSWTPALPSPIRRAILLIADDLDGRPGRPVGA